MNRRSSYNFNFSNVINAVNNRTTDVEKFGRSWGYTVIDWRGKKSRQVFASRRLAEWTLTELRLCMLADLLHIDVRESLKEISKFQDAAIVDPIQSPEAGLWTQHVPIPWEEYHPEEDLYFESEFYLKNRDWVDPETLSAENRNYRENIATNMRKLAIAKAEERVSDICECIDGKWYFEFMMKGGVILKFTYANRVIAINERAKYCLYISANILRLDIGKLLDEIDHIIMKSASYPEDTIEMREWWKWLPMPFEVDRLPGNSNYYDVRQW